MWRVAVSFAVAASWVLCSLAPAEATSLPDNGKIAFSSHELNSESDGSIYTVEPDGSNLRELTGGSYPKWSPDGTELAFVRLDADDGDISVMSADGSNLNNLFNLSLSEGPPNSGPAWSPDGTKIAFESYEDIYIMNSDGSNPTQLTATPRFIEQSAAFSPDGSQLCFFQFDYGQPGRIYVMDSVGSDRTPLVETYYGDECEWSPDGTEIAFYESPSDEVYVVDADSGRLVLISYKALDGLPILSPDRKKVAFASNRDGDYDIYTMDADGSDVAQVTNLPGDEGTPDWQPLPGTTPPNDADGPDVAQGTKKPRTGEVDRDRPERTVIVKPDDSLWSISEQRLGPEASPQQVYDHTYQMYAFNRKIIGSDPDLIFAGQRLSLPPLR